MTEDGKPSMTVTMDGTTIRVTDPVTARAALEVIDYVLTVHLEQTTSGRRNSPTRKAQHSPVDVECDKCGYEWTYKGRDAKRATCPDCQKQVRFEPDLVKRGVR